MKRFLLTALLLAAVLALPTQADFLQCPPACAGGDNDDVINGSPDPDGISGGAGNDIILGGDSRDDIFGEEGNDTIFGGFGSDMIGGQPDNDTILPGPDDDERIQISDGGPGNDSFIVLVSETINCQEIIGSDGFDVLHLIGFGPYVVEFPFGEETPIATGSAIVFQDPIALGYIFVPVPDAIAVERINGFATPTVTILDEEALGDFISANCAFLD